MNLERPLILICLSAIAIVGAFYYAAGAFINVGVGIHRLGGYARVSAVPLAPSLAGVVAGLIASMYFSWLPVWAAVLIALAPDLFYICCSVVLGLRVRHGYAPRDRELPAPAEDHGGSGK
jgi:hypothetical protein